MEQWVETNGIRLAYLDHSGPGEPLILLHGLTANAHFFNGLIQAGLNEKTRVIAVDLRGRGQSSQPAVGYTMADHAADIIGLFDALGLQQAILGGHSFGGLLTLFIAANYPERVKQLIVMDAAAAAARPEVVEAIKPSLDRLGQIMPSWAVYRDAMKHSPYYYDGFWNAALEEYYHADVETRADGSVQSRTKPAAIRQVIEGVLAVDWADVLAKIHQPVLLLNAPQPIAGPGTAPVLSEAGAMETVNALSNCVYVKTPGHHITMFFGENARHVVRTIHNFISQD